MEINHVIRLLENGAGHHLMDEHIRAKLIRQLGGMVSQIHDVHIHGSLECLSPVWDGQRGSCWCGKREGEVWWFPSTQIKKYRDSLIRDSSREEYIHAAA